eukprot:836779-Amorphochlora_amoeboformis.AAC.1
MFMYNICQVLQAVVNKDPERHFTALSRAVAAADEIGMEGSLAERCREMLARVKEKKRVEAEMRRGMEELDEDKLRAALEDAQRANADPMKVQQARARLDKIVKEKRAIEMIGAYQRKNLEEAPMQNVIDRAEQINYVTEDIKYLKHMLYDLSPEKFAQEQLKAAVRSKDQDRCIRITIRIKDMFFKAQGDMFTFRGFPKFRTPVEWANLKFTLFSSTRDELQRTMFRWTKTPIHASMIELPAKLGRDACKMFRNLMGFMGDRQYSFPEILLQELVTECLVKPPLRDEIFSHIIKQITQNPDTQSSFKGWSAMAVCLEAFPPNPEFENYFEVWMRKTITDSAKRNRFLTLLHQAIFCGARSQPPTEAEMKRIMAGETLRRKAGFQNEEKAAPDYQGLQVEVADEEIIWNEVEDISAYDDLNPQDSKSRRPAPGRPKPAGRPKPMGKPPGPKPVGPKPTAPKPMVKPSVPKFGGPKKPTGPKFGGPKKPILPKMGGPRKFGGPKKPNLRPKPSHKGRTPSTGPVIPRMMHKAPTKYGTGARKPLMAKPRPPVKPAPPMPKPAAPVSLWRATVDPASGDTYYWNVVSFWGLR